MPQLDPNKAMFLAQLFWLFVTFTVLYMCIAFYITPRLEGVFKHRATLLKSDLEIAERLHAQTESVISNYTTSQDAAKRNSVIEIEQARLSFNKEAEARKAAHTAELTQRLNEAEQRIAKQREAALATIKDSAAELAGGIVHKISGVKETAKSIQAAIKGL